MHNNNVNDLIDELATILSLQQPDNEYERIAGPVSRIAKEIARYLVSNHEIYEDFDPDAFLKTARAVPDGYKFS
jgi:hypothetical protein